MNDLLFFIDQHGGWRHLLDGAAMEGRLAERHSRGAAGLDDLLERPHRPGQARQQPRLVARYSGGLIDAGGAIDYAEQSLPTLRSFRGAEEQVARGFERIM